MLRLYIGLCVALLGACSGRMSSEGSLVTVSSLDIERYMGRWYEVAKIPNRFQAHCAHGAMAEYRLMGDDELSVINSCVTAEGKRDRAEGHARVVDPRTNAKLEVSFVSLLGCNLFWGDYWVLGLGSDYEYAVIGTPGRRYGWVLARERHLDEAQWQVVNSVLRQQAYDTEDFVLSPHRVEEGSY